MTVIFESSSDNLLFQAEHVLRGLDIESKMAHSLDEVISMLGSVYPSKIIFNLDETSIEDGMTLRTLYKGDIIGWSHDENTALYIQWSNKIVGDRKVCDSICYWLHVLENRHGVLTNSGKNATIFE